MTATDTGALELDPWEVQDDSLIFYQGFARIDDEFGSLMPFEFDQWQPQDDSLIFSQSFVETPVIQFILAGLPETTPYLDYSALVPPDGSTDISPIATTTLVCADRLSPFETDVTQIWGNTPTPSASRGLVSNKTVIEVKIGGDPWQTVYSGGASALGWTVVPSQDEERNGWRYTVAKATAFPGETGILWRVYMEDTGGNNALDSDYNFTTGTPFFPSW